jgi:2-amino-4-hydroxy-6-hydroxymethyldihydropteridine diphosphokinase
VSEYGIGLGSNIGDRCGHLIDALDALAALDGVAINRTSRVFATPPWGIEDQPEFLNACALVEASLSPEVLLRACKAIEAALGRTPAPRWGPRLIDIDLLFCDALAIASPDLTLPHPGLFDRPFVLVPLMDIVSGRSVAGRDLASALGALQGTKAAQQVRLDFEGTQRMAARF